MALYKFRTIIINMIINIIIIINWREDSMRLVAAFVQRSYDSLVLKVVSKLK